MENKYGTDDERFLEGKLYRIHSIARHPPLTGCYEPLMAEIKEIWARAVLSVGVPRDQDCGI